MAVSVTVNGRDITRLYPNEKLRNARIAYILQDNSVSPDMTVEENLWMGGFLMESPAHAKGAAEKVFEHYPRLKERRRQRAGTLSGGERRVVGVARARAMGAQILA